MNRRFICRRPSVVQTEQLFGYARHELLGQAVEKGGLEPVKKFLARL
jgi:hypothetical protein